MKRSGFAVKTYQPPQAAPPRRAERAGVISQVAATVRAFPKEKVIVCLAYRQLVRLLPCARCGYPGPNQFCHADLGKGMSLKTDDRRGWSGCGPHHGVAGCHYLVGSSGRFPRKERRRLEVQYGEWTRQQILAAGMWPSGLPLWADEPNT